MRKVLSFSFALLFVAFCNLAFAADTLKYSISRVNNWAFFGSENPIVKVVSTNDNEFELPYKLSCFIDAYNSNPVYRFFQSGSVQAKDSSVLSFSFNSAIPGFYKVAFIDNSKPVGFVNIAYEPDKINVELSGKEDFTTIAYYASLDLRDIAADFRIEKVKELSGKIKTVYKFSANSLNGKINGYFALPSGVKKAPVLLSVIEKSKISKNCLADFSADDNTAELVLYLNDLNESTIKQSCSDIIRAVDFLYGNDEVNREKIYIKGRGVAASYVLLACAADERIAAGVIESADFNFILQKFSLETIANKIKQVICMGVGLQDNEYNLQLAFSVYNKLNTQKEYFVFPNNNYFLPDKWKKARNSFLVRCLEK